MTTLNQIGIPLSGSTGSGLITGATAPTMSSVAIDNITIATNTISSTNSNGNINITPNGSGVTSLGTLSPSGTSGKVQVLGGASTNLSVGAFVNSGSASSYILYKSRGTAPGSHVTVNTGDSLGTYSWVGDDGASYLTAGSIVCSATGTISTGVIPSQMLFSTNNASGSLTTALTLNSSQNAIFAGSVTVGNLSLSGNTISSTNTNGNINLTPNGLGVVSLGAFAPNGTTGVVQVMGASTGSLALGTFFSGNTPALFLTYRSRAAAPGFRGAVQNGDTIGGSSYLADDGTSWLTVGSLSVAASGSISTGIVPTAMTLSTMNTSGVLTAALTLSNAQAATFGGAVNVGNLSLSGNTISSTSSNGHLFETTNGQGQYVFGQSGNTAPFALNAVRSSWLSNVGVPGTSQGLIASWSYLNSATGANFTFNKSRSTTIGSVTAVQGGDSIGLINYGADNGTSVSVRATIQCNVTTVGANVGTQFVFQTGAPASGSVATALTLSDDQSATFTGLIVPAQTIGIKGTTTNNDAQAGSFGEYVSSSVLVGSAVALTTETAINVTSISLSAGDWEAYGNVLFAGDATTTVLTAGGWILSTSAGSPSNDYALTNYANYTIFGGGAGNPGMSVPSKRFSLAGTTTIYLIAYSSFAIGANSAYGMIYARRVR